MDDLKHYSVMLHESIDLLNIKPDGIYVDATLGGGGHSLEIVKNLSTGHLYAIDQDDYALNKSHERLKDYLDKVTFIKGNFENIKTLLNDLNVSKVDGIVYDLGVSSFQFDDADRGFSYRFNAPLDMRMNKDNSLSAKDVVNNYSYDDLKRIFYDYGEENFAPLIAKAICKYRETKVIDTTFDLVDIVRSALPSKVLRKESHPAKRVFQAIRIEVNKELDVLKTSLKDALTLLNPDGRIAVITFHSLEDRIVKNIFKEATTLDLPKDIPFIPEGMKVEYELINKKVILPNDAELDENNRSHSAKLRGIRKLDN